MKMIHAFVLATMMSGGVALDAGAGDGISLTAPGQSTIWVEGEVASYAGKAAEKAPCA